MTNKVRVMFYWEYPLGMQAAIRTQAHYEECYLAGAINHGRRLIVAPYADEPAEEIEPVPGPELQDDEDHQNYYSDTIGPILAAAHAVGFDPRDVAEAALSFAQGMFNEALMAAQEREMETLQAIHALNDEDCDPPSAS